MKYDITIIEIIPEKEKQEIKTQIKKETKIKKTIAKK